VTVSPRPRPAGGLITVEELAAYLAVSVAWVRKGVLERTLPCTKIGRHVRFTPEQVEHIVRSGERPARETVGTIQHRRGSARTRL
jgi:excisionase family DNA binding protein